MVFLFCLFSFNPETALCPKLGLKTQLYVHGLLRDHGSGDGVTSPRDGTVEALPERPTPPPGGRASCTLHGSQAAGTQGPSPLASKKQVQS